MANIVKPFIIKALSLAPYRGWPKIVKGSFIPVFMLHRFSCPDTGVVGHDILHMQRAFEFLRKKNIDIVSMATAIDLARQGERLVRPSVCFTIDDGYWDHFELGLDLFKRFDVPCTYFLPTKVIQDKLWIWDAKLEYIYDQAIERDRVAELHSALMANASEARSIVVTNWFNRLKGCNQTTVDDEIERVSCLLGIEIPSSPSPKYRSIDVKDAATLERAGMNVAPHSRTHRILSQLSDVESRDEIAGSWQDIQSWVEKPTKVFCYPVGKKEDFGARDERFVEEAGLNYAVSAIEGSLELPLDAKNYSIKRYSMPDDIIDFFQYSTWIEEFKARFRSATAKPRN